MRSERPLAAARKGGSRFPVPSCSMSRTLLIICEEVRMKSFLLVCIVCLGPFRLLADAHGPAFGYATSAFGAGDSSIESVAMYRAGVTMLGPRFSYGLNENLQLSISAPFHLNHG